MWTWDDFAVKAAAQRLKDLENSIKFESQDDSWEDKRDNFLSKINQVRALTDLRVLFNQLRRLENSLKYNHQSEAWEQWKRSYWWVMTDPNSNLSLSVTRFIICLTFMERSLFEEAHSNSWIKSDRDIWLAECDSLIDSLMRLSFYDELFLNVDVLLQEFGHNSLRSYIREVNNVISTINSAARKLDAATKDLGLGDTVTGALGIGSAIMFGAGLILAPVSAGTSLNLTGLGAAYGVGSAVTGVLSGIVQVVWDETKAKEVQEEMKKITAETLAVTEMLESYGTAATKLQTKLNGLGRFRALKYLQDVGLGGKSTYTGIRQVLDVSRMRRVVSEMRPDLLARGEGTLVAFRVAAPGVTLPRFNSDGTTRILIREATTLHSAAVKLAAVLTVISLWFAIQTTIEGHKKYTDGSKLAREFRDMASSLTSVKDVILEAYGNDP